MKIINPATGNIIEEISEDTIKTLADKLNLLKTGQQSWKDKTVEERLDKIEKFGEIIQGDVEELALILSTETGKPIQQARNEIKGAHNRIDHLMLNAPKWLAHEKVIQEGNTLESIEYEPLGVIANISAWNYPYNVGYNVFLYALTAGNGVLYKPSEYSSLTGKAITKRLYQAGIPENIFQCSIGGKEVGQLILEMDFDGYFFTGSYSTGKYIAREVAHKLVPVQLELGGKDPLYVMEDVPDIKKAAINAAEGSFYNAGQSCCAIERIYVSEKIYESFLQYFIEEVSTYRLGDPTDENTFIGPLTRPQQLTALSDQVKDAQSKGASIALGGHPLKNSGNYFEPTIVVNTNHSMKIMKDESFGPIIGIQKVSSDEEAIELMLDTDYGLTSAVFGSDEERVDIILKAMNSGTVYWNCCDRVSPNIPWSGRKNSGLGSTLSTQGIRAFVQPKSYQMRP